MHGSDGIHPLDFQKTHRLGKDAALHLVQQFPLQTLSLGLSHPDLSPLSRQIDPSRAAEVSVPKLVKVSLQLVNGIALPSRSSFVLVTKPSMCRLSIHLA